MNELKTLKDLPIMESPHFKRIYMKERKLPDTVKEYNKHIATPEYTTMQVKAIDIIDLKAEAVKWVKFYRKHQEELPAGVTQTLFDESAIILWIVEFFNLTEEDLK